MAAEAVKIPVDSFESFPSRFDCVEGTRCFLIVATPAAVLGYTMRLTHHTNIEQKMLFLTVRSY